MAKQSAPIQEVARLLDLVPYLSTHSHISLKELAAEFGVTEKAMANELTALSMCGLPGYTPYELIEIYFESGFVTINNHEALDIPRALTKLEVASLLIGLQLLKDLPENNQPQVANRIESLSAKLNELLGARIEVEADPDISHLAELSRGIAERATFTISYASPLRDGSHERDISPLSIYRQGLHTYVQAYCHAAQAIRNFRSDRISSIIRSKTQPAPEVTDSPSEKYNVTLKVLGRKRAIAELLSLDSIPTSGEIGVEVYSLAWVERSVLAYSPDLALISPAAGRAAIKSSLENILALYR
ncbi:COG2378 Predicted transcriptional regulator [Candidatus Nanopelagicaceae bacterium]